MPHIIMNLSCNAVALPQCRKVDLIILFFHQVLVFFLQHQIQFRAGIPKTDHLLFQIQNSARSARQQYRSHDQHTVRRPQKGLPDNLFPIEKSEPRNTQEPEPHLLFFRTVIQKNRHEKTEFRQDKADRKHPRKAHTMPSSVVHTAAICRRSHRQQQRYDRRCKPSRLSRHKQTAGKQQSFIHNPLHSTLSLSTAIFPGYLPLSRTRYDNHIIITGLPPHLF